MKNTIALVAFAALLLLFVSTNVGNGQMNPPMPKGPGCPYSDPSGGCLQRPHSLQAANLVAIEAHLQTTYKCLPGSQDLYIYSVTVKNIGPVTFAPQHATGATVIMEDQHFAPWPSPTYDLSAEQKHGWSWSTAGIIGPTLPPNATATSLITIPYYSADPAHMTKYPVHTFEVGVAMDWGPVKGFVYNRGGLTVDVPAPKGC